MLKNIFTLAFFCCLPLGGVAWTEEVAEPSSDTKKAGERMTLMIKDVEYAFRWCPTGTFMMGSPEDELGRWDDDEKQYEVTLTQGFWMLETEVTQEMWQSVMGENPSRFKDGKRHPVEMVSWDDCQEYIEKLNALEVMPTGYRFSLPTKVQWEYACRAGTATALNNGKDLTSERQACPNLDEVGWYGKNSDMKTHEVGLKKPNAWGLYDMHGNVREWCLDWYVSSDGSETDSMEPSTDSGYVLCGGGWDSEARFCRSAFQNFSDPDFRYIIDGLRLTLVHENQNQ